MLLGLHSYPEFYSLCYCCQPLELLIVCQYSLCLQAQVVLRQVAMFHIKSYRKKISANACRTTLCLGFDSPRGILVAQRVEQIVLHPLLPMFIEKILLRTDANACVTTWCRCSTPRSSLHTTVAEWIGKCFAYCCRIGSRLCTP